MLISPENLLDQHRRISAALSAWIEDPGFLAVWQHADSEQDLREIFLRSDRFILLKLSIESATGELIGQRIEALPLPDDARVVAMHRGGKLFPTEPRQVLQENDRLTVVGDPEDIEKVYNQFGTEVHDREERN